MIKCIKKLLSGYSYQQELEKYVTSNYPKSTYDVEVLVKQYERANSGGLNVR